MSGPRRVVVTGFGAVTPLGLNAATTWQGIREGRSGIDLITQFDTTDSPVKFAGEVKNFDAVKTLETLFPAKDLRKVGRFAHLALSASLEAFHHAGLVKGEFDARRAGTAIGVGMGGLPEIEDTHKDFLGKGFRRISPFFITQSIPNLASGMVSMSFGLKGSNLCHTTACASGAHAIGESFLSIRNGQNDIVLAGGSESVVCALGIGGFAALRALSTRNESPQTASRPYDKDRDGFVLAEGATTLVLEEYEHAKKRGAKIYAEIVGYGLSGDAYHFTLPAPEGAGGGQAMDDAFKMAGITGKQIDYVNTHATSTPAGDREEATAVSLRVDRTRCQVSSTKSMTGHLLGAAGAIEAMFAVQALENQFVPPTINLDSLDPDCEKTGLNFTPNQGVERDLEYVLSNSFGFGGTNATILFKKAARA